MGKYNQRRNLFENLLETTSRRIQAVHRKANRNRPRHRKLVTNIKKIRHLVRMAQEPTGETP